MAFSKCIRLNDLLVIATLVALTVLNTNGQEECADDTSHTFERTTGVTIAASHFLFTELQMVQTRVNGTWHYECHFLCAATSNCGGYFIDHTRKTCRLLAPLSAAENVPIRDSLQPFKGSLFKKTCLRSPTSCKRQWIFDRVVGMELEDNDDAVFNDTASATDCQQACLDEVRFKCRSAEYNYDTGSCALSRNDRRTLPDAFRASEHNVDYLENQCIAVPDKCVFSHKAKTSFPYALTRMALPPQDLNLDACERHCTGNEDFVCRAFMYDVLQNECLLSSDDKWSVHPSVYDAVQGYDYYERSNCLDVTMKCDASTMTAILTVGYPFRGRVYAMVNPDDCYYEPSKTNSSQVALSLPLKSSICGTTNMGNGTYTNSIIVQHHPNILRSSDRRIDVSCEYEEHKIRLKAGKQISEPEDMSNITSVVTGVAPTPDVRLRIVDASGKDVVGVDLGSDVFLRVEVLDDHVYGIMGTSLIARSGDSTENITLIDGHGCPIETSVFPPLETLTGSKDLQAPFQAFRFTADGVVRFQITVSFCLDKCNPVYCDTDELGNVTSYGRRKRWVASDSALQTGDIVSDVIMEGALFVRARLERQEITDTRRPSVDALNNRMKICTSPSIVIGVSAMAAIMQIGIVCASMVLLCTGRSKTEHMMVSGSGSISSDVVEVESQCYSGLVGSMSTQELYNPAKRGPGSTCHNTVASYLH